MNRREVLKGTTAVVAAVAWPTAVLTASPSIDVPIVSGSPHGVFVDGGRGAAGVRVQLMSHVFKDGEVTSKLLGNVATLDERGRAEIRFPPMSEGVVHALALDDPWSSIDLKVYAVNGPPL